MAYRILFTAPASGAAAETALKLARRCKRRTKIVAFTDASHGVTDGSRAITSRSPDGRAFSALRSNTTFMPYCGFFGEGTDTISCFRRYLEDSASGLERPAAVIVETVQVQGGVRIASEHWLQTLAALCAEFDMLLIIDDSLTGCSATGPYFGFEDARISPDMVIASNAIAGGLPMSMLLLRPELNAWRPGEQMGEMQGNGLAFAAATALLEECNTPPSNRARASSHILSEELHKLAARHIRGKIRVRGKGVVWGLDLARPGAAAVVSAWALERGVIVEPARLKDEVLLIRPAVTIDETTLREGLDRLDEAVSDFVGHEARRPVPSAAL
jgi:diaminobutyrate-2-oxoglutarate transaminase